MHWTRSIKSAETGKKCQTQSTRLVAVAVSAAATTLLGVYFIVEMSIGSLDSRVTGLADDFRAATGELGALREDSSYVRAQVDSLTRLTENRDPRAEAEAQINQRFAEIEFALRRLNGALQEVLTETRASSNPAIRQVVDEIVARIEQTEQLELQLSNVQRDFFFALRMADAVESELDLFIRAGAVSRHEQRLTEYLATLNEISEEIDGMATGLTAIATSNE